jgi:sulfide dehydrogenase cytochrome subunit
MRPFASRLHFALFLLSAAAVATAAAPGDASSCFACHGSNGVSTSGDNPTIAGMSVAYLDKQMAGYQSGSRSCAVPSPYDMCAIAKQTTRAQVGSTSAFFAAQSFVAAKQTVEPALVAVGKALHEGRCGMCHTRGGSAANDDAGILAGQWQPYLEATLKAFVAGARPQPAPMKQKTATLTPDDIHALAQYYASEASK